MYGSPGHYPQALVSRSPSPSYKFHHSPSPPPMKKLKYKKNYFSPEPFRHRPKTPPADEFWDTKRGRGRPPSPTYLPRDSPRHYSAERTDRISLPQYSEDRKQSRRLKNKRDDSFKKIPKERSTSRSGKRSKQVSEDGDRAKQRTSTSKEIL